MLHIIGDSHTAVLSCHATVHTVHGGSARGLSRKTSRLQAGETVRTIIRSHPRDAFALKFGQVDIEHVFAFKRFLDPNLRTEDEIETTVKSYMKSYISFVDELLAEGVCLRGIVCVHPPSIPRTSDWLNNLKVRCWENQEVSSPNMVRFLRELNESACEEYDSRFARHQRLNRALADACAQRGLEFLDYFDALLDDASGHLRPECAPACTEDHHIGGLSHEAHTIIDTCKHRIQSNGIEHEPK